MIPKYDDNNDNDNKINYVFYINKLSELTEIIIDALSKKGYAPAI